MLGLLVIIIVSWVLLHFIEKKNIEDLGIIPNTRRLSQFFLGLLVIVVITLLNIYIETLVLNVDWKLNDVDYYSMFEALWYHLKSALTEDLVFRGVILYILIRRIGHKWAILISAVVFGVYHWFSYGIIGGKVILLAYVFIITGFTGYVWAFTFHKTKSVMMGLGFHLGINFINTCFFESQPYGELIFQEVSRTKIEDWNWLFFNLYKGLFPSIVTLIFVKQYLKFKPKKILLEQN